MSARQKAKDLIELALDDGATLEERRTAALKAVKFIEKHDLLASPLDGLLSSDNEVVSSVANIVQGLTNPVLVKSVKKVGEHIGRARTRRRYRE